MNPILLTLLKNSGLDIDNVNATLARLETALDTLDKVVKKIDAIEQSVLSIEQVLENIYVDA